MWNHCPEIFWLECCPEGAPVKVRLHRAPGREIHGQRSAHRTRRGDRCRHRRQQPRPPPRPPRLARHRPDRQGGAAQPGRVHRARLELHLPGRPLPRDGRPDAGLGAPVQGARACSPSPAATRSRAPRSAWRSCAAGCPRPRRGASRPSWSARTTWSRRCPFLDKDKILGAFWCPSVGVVDSLRAGTLMRESALALGALTVVPTVEVTGLDVEQGRIRRVRTSGGRHRGRDRGHRLRRVEPEDRQDGRRGHPAHPGRAPDDLRRPGPAAGRARGRDLLPDHPGHGHLLLRAPARRRHGGRLLRAPGDPAQPGGHPVDRAGQAVADRDALHRGRLRPAAGAGPRADAGGAGRRRGRDPLRDQRPALADPGRAADPGRDPGGQGPLVGRRGVDQGGPGHRPGGGRVDDPRPLRDRRPPLRHRPLLPAPAHPRARALAHLGGVQQDLRHRAPVASSGTASAASGCPR